MYLKMGIVSEDVKTLQESLTLLNYRLGKVDGDFGSKTEKAVIRFQIDHDLYVDGIVGSNTWNEIQNQILIHQEEQNSIGLEDSQPFSWQRVAADKYRDGYDRFHLRQDVAEAYLKVREEVLEAGAMITSSGSKRALNASVGAARSVTSFHYVGRALDLNVSSGMERPASAPYIITKDNDRYWRVYARAEGGQQMELESLTYHSRATPKIILGKFIDLTAIFKTHGFERIRHRKDFLQGGSWKGAEWWHFQYEKGLEKGKSTFGEELLKMYSINQLEDSKPWRFKDRVYGENWF